MTASLELWSLEMIRDQVVEKSVHQRLRERFLQNNALTLNNYLILAENNASSIRKSRDGAVGSPQFDPYQRGHAVMGSAVNHCFISIRYCKVF